MEDVPFLGPKWSTCPKQFFFWNIINIILIYILAPHSFDPPFFLKGGGVNFDYLPWEGDLKN